VRINWKVNYWLISACLFNLVEEYFYAENGQVRLTTIAGTKDTSSRLTQNGFHRDAQSHLHVQVNSHAFAQMYTARRDRSAMLRNPWVSTLTPRYHSLGSYWPSRTFAFGRSLAAVSVQSVTFSFSPAIILSPVILSSLFDIFPSRAQIWFLKFDSFDDSQEPESYIAIKQKCSKKIINGDLNKK